MDIRERARKMLADLKAKSGGSGYFRPAKCGPNDEGDSVRLLCPPYFDAIDHDPWIQFQEWSIPLAGQEYPHRCAASFQFGLPDPVKELRDTLKEESEEAAAEYALGDKYVMLVEHEGDVKVWEFGNMVAKQILKFTSNKKWPLLWDVARGRRVNVKRTGEGLGTKYDLTPDPDSEPLANADRILKRANAIDLSNYVIVETEDTLTELLDGVYDRDTARERREKRDSMGKRPLGPFVSKATAIAADKAADELPYESVGKKVGAKKAAPVQEEPEDTASLVGATVSFEDDNGEQVAGVVLKEATNKAGKLLITVETDDGEKWEMLASEAELVEEPEEEPEPELEPEPSAKPTRKRVASDPADIRSAPSSVSSKVAEMKARAAAKVKGKGGK